MAKGIPTYEQFRRSLAGTPMAGEARGIYNAALKGGINPALVAGIAGAESGFGAKGYAVGRNNPYGLMGFRFKNYSQATTKLADTLKSRSLGYPQAYGKSGLRGIIGIYTPYGAANGPNNDPSAHTRNIINIGRSTGGDPSQVYASGPLVPSVDNEAPAAPAAPRMSGPMPSRVGGGAVDPGLGQALLRQYLRSSTGEVTSAEMRENTMRLARAAGRSRVMSMLPQQSATTPGTATTPPTTQAPGGAPDTGAMLNYGNIGEVARPLPTKLSGSSYGYSDPEGQGGRHLAHDWFAPGNTPLASPVSGTVFRIKPDASIGKKASGQVFGGSVYIRDTNNRVWVFRHVENPQQYTQAGGKVRAGQRIGATKPWSGSAHAHIELYGPGPYEYSPKRAMNPYDFFRKAGIR